MKRGHAPDPWRAEDRFTVVCTIVAILAVLAALGVSAFGQGARVADHTGRTLDVKGVQVARAGPLELSCGKVAPNRWRVRVRNAGLPQVSAVSLPAGDQVFLAGVLVGTPPGWTLEWAAVRGAELVGSHDRHDVYQALGPGDPVYQHPGVIAPAGTWFLPGGSAVWWDIVPVLPEGPPGASSDVRRLLGIRDDQADYVEVECARALWTLSPGSFDPRAADPRDLGWVALNFWRWRGGMFPEAVGWKDWGAVPWAEGDSAHHYDHLARVVERYVRTGDPWAWSWAYQLARYHASQVFIDCDGASDVRWMMRYEKSPYGSYAGAGQPPRVSHEWDAGLLAVAHLSQDQDLLRACALRLDYLAKVDPHPRYYGARMIGWPLHNLWAHHVISGDPRAATAAGRILSRAFGSLRPGELLWPDDSGTGRQPWQDGIFHAARLLWLEEGVGEAYRARGEEMMRAVLATARPNGEGLQIEMKPGQWLPPAATSFVLPLAMAVGTEDQRARAVHTVANLGWAGWGDAIDAGHRSMTNRAYGPGAEKVMAEWAWGFRWLP